MRVVSRSTFSGSPEDRALRWNPEMLASSSFSAWHSNTDGVPLSAASVVLCGAALEVALCALLRPKT